MESGIEIKGKVSKKEGFCRLLEIAGQKKGWLTLSAVLAVISEIMTLVPFYIAYLLAVGMLGTASPDQAYMMDLVICGVVAFALRGITLYASSMVSHVSAFNILYSLRVRLSQHLWEEQSRAHGWNLKGRRQETGM